MTHVRRIETILLQNLERRLMRQSNHFTIQNNLKRDASVYLEPEGAVVEMGPKEELVVYDEYSERPVCIYIDSEPDGTTVLSLWPGDGDVRVEKDGKDVFNE